MIQILTARSTGEPPLSVHPEVLGQHVQPDEGLITDVARLVSRLGGEVVPPLRPTLGGKVDGLGALLLHGLD